MVATSDSRSAQARAKLKHPVVDADGHYTEIMPVFLDYIRDVGGGNMAEQYIEASPLRKHGIPATQTLAQRKDRWTPLLSWWGGPTDARDRATVMVPSLLNERMDEFGIDFMILYPGQGLFVTAIEDDELRRAVCRAFNNYTAEQYGAYPDRMTPVAVIPTATPQEGIEELEHAVKDLGLKAAVFRGNVDRPIPSIQREHPEVAQLITRPELFGMDSDYDYDALWAKCVELGVAVTFHGGIGGIGKESVSNYVYNHVGGLAGGHHKLCKAIFMGGVTNRFPTLKFAFLEAGVGWACSLYADVIGHWEKRNGKAIHQYDPDRLDRRLMMEIVREYGDERTRSYVDNLGESYGGESRPDVLDEFAAMGIEEGETFVDRFVEPFYFGCEADDPITAQAFATKVNPFNARLKPIIGSDIGHWDVPVMNAVLGEAHELVERGAMTEEDFKDFVFANPVTLHAHMNPNFFKGTRVEVEVDKLLGK